MPSPRDKHKERTTRDSKKQNMSERTKGKQKKLRIWREKNSRNEHPA